VYPPVRGFGVQQAVHVGGQQLGVGAVFQDLVNDRAVGAQAFQCLGVGGVAARRLFARRQAQLVEQRLAQLLGTIYIELITDFCINIVQDTVQLAPQAVTEGADTGGVDCKADALHVGQHPGQRQLHLVQQLALAALVQRGGQRVAQARQHARIGRGLTGKGGVYAVLGGQGVHLIAAGRRV